MSTLTCLHADWEATTALDIVFSTDRMRESCDDSLRGMVGWIGEQQQLKIAWLHASFRSTNLSMFVPVGHVGVAHRLLKLITFVAILQFYLCILP